MRQKQENNWAKAAEALRAGVRRTPPGQSGELNNGYHIRSTWRERELFSGFYTGGIHPPGVCGVQGRKPEKKEEESEWKT